MESEKPAAFRPNQQVGVMILVILTALFIPLLGVAWLARDYFRPKPAVVVEPIGLRETIERSADEALPARPIAAERPVLTVPGSQTGDSLRAIAEAQGATILELEEGRFLVTGPDGAIHAFARALNVEPPAAPEEGLFEVQIRKAP